MSKAQDVGSGTDHHEMEIAAVRAKIVAVKAEIREIEAEMEDVKFDYPDQRRPGLELTLHELTLHEELVKLLRELNTLLTKGSQASGTPSGAKTIELAMPDFLRVDEQEKKLMVNRFAQLVPGAVYTDSLYYYEDALDSVIGKQRHHQYEYEDEDELIKAPTLCVAHAESDQEDSHMQLTSDIKIADHNVVDKGQDATCVGLHETQAKGAKLVKEVPKRYEEFAKLPNELPPAVMPAFKEKQPMPERQVPEAVLRPQRACTDMKVVQFHRSGHATQVMSRVGAAGRLLRF
ncbi:hypothetical protein QJQ45_006798 [Haematococcus lacustris]|nr:hypothetical protein QJQ45_006798 [Haematococcus lacustris]